MTRRPPDAYAIGLSKDVPAAATDGPVLDDLVDRPRWQQWSALALMPMLSTLLAPRPVLTALLGAAGRIATRRLRRVPRRSPDPTLELPDPLVLRSNALLKSPDLLIHPQQDRDDRIATLVIDRFGRGALHTRKIPCKSRKPCPQTDGLNAYICSSIWRDARSHD